LGLVAPNLTALAPVKPVPVMVTVVPPPGEPWLGSTLVAALDYYSELLNLVQGRISKAQGSKELNEALASVLAGLVPDRGRQADGRVRAAGPVECDPARRPGVAAGAARARLAAARGGPLQTGSHGIGQDGSQTSPITSVYRLMQ
jgi:hypothetical protein